MEDLLFKQGIVCFLCREERCDTFFLLGQFKEIDQTGLAYIQTDDNDFLAQ